MTRFTTSDYCQLELADDLHTLLVDSALAAIETDAPLTQIEAALRSLSQLKGQNRSKSGRRPSVKQPFASQIWRSAVFHVCPSIHQYMLKKRSKLLSPEIIVRNRPKIVFAAQSG